MNGWLDTKQNIKWTLYLLIALPIAGVFFLKEAFDKAMQRSKSQ